MVFTKDDLAVVITCFTEKEWTVTLNPLDYSTWNILQELVYEGRREPFASIKDLQNVIRDKWHNVDQRMGKAILQWKRHLAAVAKQMEDLFSTFSANQLTDDYCDVLMWPAYERQHER